MSSTEPTSPPTYNTNYTLSPLSSSPQTSMPNPLSMNIPMPLPEILLNSSLTSLPMSDQSGKVPLSYLND